MTSPKRLGERYGDRVNTPIQNRILGLIKSGPTSCLHVMTVFEELGIKRTDTSRAVVNLLNSRQLSINGEGKLLTLR